MLDVVVDISHFQQVSDFAAVKSSGIVGVIHKATQGTGYTDPSYAQHKSAALEAGLLWGAYHFADASDPAAQAQHFLSVTGGDPGTLHILDMEQNYAAGQPEASMTIAQAEQFVTGIFNATGRYPGFYSGSYIKELLGNQHNATLANCWLWLAQYSTSAVVPPAWPYWSMWQYTDGSNGQQPVAGIGNCDRSRFNGDMNGLLKLWGAA